MPDAIDDACPDCGHHVELHGPEGCTVSACGCRQTGDAR